ncbi:hypothetical protein TPA0910_59210 [Streptomyces hygroscopicus subsp. sporocinereus]|uniref:Integral membrane protein n=1 Tax=Streptomyces hygroscopicus TaxID=1912 RepID=A0ABQ3U7A3_STRHY|nr:hypothetical protein TPA0910_59210 [Streptomyces hygroscopicus]
MMGSRSRFDAADIAAAACGWIIIVAIAATPGFLFHDGQLTTLLVAVGTVVGGGWAWLRLR